MCCFSRPVQSVSATNIFARSAEGGRQYLVYSMKLRAKEELAMVLPLPIKPGSGEKAISFIDLKDYAEFFDDLSKGFPVPLTKGPLSRSLGAPPKPEAKLEVVTVGSFEASFVPTMADFSRLDERFRLPSGTWEKLPTYRNHGFAVFKLKPGESKVHPMAFSFPRAHPAELFFPTVHIHDGKVHDRADFDHALYCQGADTGMRWQESPQPASMFMRGIDRSQGIVDGKAHVYRKRLVGTYTNQDTWV
jgi:hypothetical protein